MTAVGPGAENTRRFIDHLARILGEEHVIGPDDPRLDQVRDRFHPFRGTAREPLPGGAVRPSNVAELREVLAAANRFEVRLWTSSRGRNFGYGAAAPVCSGDVVLSLIRMDRILELDEERAYALVEPGVNYQMLWEEIQRRGLKLWPGTPAAPYGSIIGNSLERGVGNDVFSDHWESLCGLEVMLANGTLLRTGTGSLTGSTTWSENKHGYGPVLDGLFSQSNLGVVTKAGVWLTPEPPAFRYSQIFLEDRASTAAFFDVLARLRRSRVIETGVSNGPRVFGTDDPAAYVTMARVGYSGSRAVVDAKWQDTQDAFRLVPGVRFESTAYEAPFDTSTWPSSTCLVAGVPTDGEHPDWNNAHYCLFGTMIIPNTGRDYVKAWELIDKLSTRYSVPQPFAPSFHMHTARSLIIMITAPLEGDPYHPEGLPLPHNDASVDFLRALFDEAATRGWTEYRTGTLYMDQTLVHQDFEDGSKAWVYEQLKTALDPKGILSPGKSGIWGSAKQ